jgi:Fe-S-cluster containining protein
VSRPGVGRRAVWSLPAEMEAADADLVRSLDSATRRGEARAGDHVACRVGCTGCCIGPFEITALDAARLERGVRELTSRDPEAASALVERASRQWSRMVEAFPGDPGTGVLSEDEAARVAFFTRFGETPCPALDPTRGSCLLYPWRPLFCRTYGLPVRHGAEVLEPCPLNFMHAYAHEVTAATIVPDPEDREGSLLGRVRRLGVWGDTVVSAVLGGCGLG